MHPVRLDLKGKHLLVRFPYDDEMVERIRTISGRRWIKAENAWRVPADWHTATELRRTFGDALSMTRAVKRWGRAERERQEELAALASDAETGVDLPWLRQRNPKLWEAVHLGPKGLGMSESERAEALRGPASFQAADVSFMVNTRNPLNANHMGLGKTLETIAAIVEGGIDDGPVLVVAPVSAAEGTWPEELRRWQDNPVWVARGSRARKLETHEEFLSWVSPQPTLKGQELPGNPGWLVVNPEQIGHRERVEKCPAHSDLKHKTKEGLKRIQACSDRGDLMDEEELFDDPHCFFEKVIPYPDLFSIEWRAIIFDECHENGILNPKAQTGAGARGLRADNRFLLSGTPMGGREVRMFEILQFLRPDVFTSKWRFAEQYLEVNTSTFYLKGGRGATGTSRKIGGIKRCYRHRIGTLPRPPKGECAECDQYELNFYQTLNPYVLRRTKDEVLPDLPPKIRTDIWVPFASERHRKQYETFADDAEVRLNNERITATNVISEYVRLSQFAWGEYDDGMVPTTKSAKLQALDEKLEELGVYDPSSGEQAVIFSQYKSIVDVVHEWLARERLGTAVGKLTGDTTKKGERAALKESFQGDGGLRALVISTKAGGTSLTLDRASNVFILDETWNPDNEEQAEDRCHRASRIHQVNIYRIRTKDTMDEFRMELAWDKAVRNSSVLDLRRIKLKSDA